MTQPVTCAVRGPMLSASTTLSAGATLPVGAPLLPLPGDSEQRLPALELMYLLQSKGRQTGLEAGRVEVTKAKVARDGAREAEMKALTEAQEASQHRSFWDDVGKVCATVGKIAAVVGSVAIAVASLGAATPIAALAIAGAVLSTAGFVQGETHVLEKLGVDANAAGWVGFGLSMGGAVCSLGAGAVGAVPTGFMKTAGVAASVTGGVGNVVSGGAKTSSAVHAKDEMDARADATAARNAMTRMQRQISLIIEELKGADESSGRSLGHLQGAIEARDGALGAAMMRA